MSPQSSYDRYLDTLVGKELLSKYSLTDTGTWQVLGGEIDTGQDSFTPKLGHYNGTLGDIIQYAVQLTEFFGPACVGRIEAVIVVNINSTSNPKQVSLVKQKLALERQLEQINKQLMPSTNG